MRGGEIHPDVEFILRSNPHDYEGSKDLARELYFFLEKNPPGDWIELHMFGSFPEHFDEDDLGHHYWKFVAQLKANNSILDATKQTLFIGADFPGQTGEAFIQSLSLSYPNWTRKVVFTLDGGNMAANQKFYYAVPESMGAPTFSVGGFAGGFFLAEDGVLVGGVPYDLWESDNVGLGITTVKVG